MSLLHNCRRAVARLVAPLREAYAQGAVRRDLDYYLAGRSDIGRERLERRTRRKLTVYFRALLNLSRPNDEAARPAYYRFIRDVDEVLRQAAESRDDANLRYLSARVASELLGRGSRSRRVHLEAVKRWRRVLEDDTGDIDRVRFQLGKAMYFAGDFEGARHYLSALNETALGRGARRWCRRKLKIIKTLERARECRETAKAVLAGASGGNTELERDLWGVVQSNLPESVPPEQVRPVVSRLAEVLAFLGSPAGEVACESQRRLATAKAVDSRADAESDRRRVIVSGFRWSGSGAISDWLRGHPDVHEPFGGRFRPGKPAGRLLRAMDGSAARLGLALYDFTVSSVLGIECKVKSGKTFRRAWLESLLQTGGEPGAVAAAYRAFLEAVPLDADEFQAGLRQAYARFLQKLLAQGDRPGGLALLNNAVYAADLRLLAFLGDTRVVVVSRDARDQFADQTWFKRGHHDVERFLERLKRDRAAYRRALAEPGVAERVLEVRFEDFVQSAEWRERVAEFLGLSVADFGKGRFDPSASARNIGLYRDLPDQAAVREIERVFPEVCGVGPET